jgi:hypothetical protein
MAPDRRFEGTDFSKRSRLSAQMAKLVAHSTVTCAYYKHGLYEEDRHPPKSFFFNGNPASWRVHQSFVPNGLKAWGHASFDEILNDGSYLMHLTAYLIANEFVLIIDDEWTHGTLKSVERTWSLNWEEINTRNPPQKVQNKPISLTPCFDENWIVLQWKWMKTLNKLSSSSLIP